MKKKGKTQKIIKKTLNVCFSYFKNIIYNLFTNFYPNDDT